MAPPSRKCSVSKCGQEIPESLEDLRLCLNHYIEDVFQKLKGATDHSRRGAGIDRKTLDWLLVQVDCAVEVLGRETTTLDSDQRSRLLELLLGIANLNEHVRHQTIGARHPS